jgi:hypothetical protein
MRSALYWQNQPIAPQLSLRQTDAKSPAIFEEFLQKAPNEPNPLGPAQARQGLELDFRDSKTADHPGHRHIMPRLAFAYEDLRFQKLTITIEK